MSLKDTKTEDLIRNAAALREELRGLRFAVAGSKNRNVKRARAIRKEVARILTEVGRRA